MGTRVGFAYGAFDVLDVDHVRYLTGARALCDHLIAGVATDRLVQAVRGVPPVVPLMQRLQIVANMKAVDDAVPIDGFDTLEAMECLQFDVVIYPRERDQLGLEVWAEELEVAGVELVKDLSASGQGRVGR